MLNLDKYKKSFTDASSNDQGKVLVESNEVVFKFDDYIRDTYPGVCGIDAIFDYKSDDGIVNRYFLEFKTGDNYTVSKILEKALSSLIVYFKDDGEIRQSFEKHYFFLVIEKHKERVYNGINSMSMKTSANNRDNNFQAMFNKLKAIYFSDARCITGNDIMEMFRL